MALPFMHYLREAFSAKPIGMFVAPNWIGLTVMTILGIAVDPGFFVLGAGLECGYLYWLTSNRRFRNLVEAKELHAVQQEGVQRRQLRLADLAPVDQSRCAKLEGRCRGVLEQQRSQGIAASDLRGQGEGFARLNWIYLNLLLTRQNIRRVMGSSLDIGGEDSLKQRIARLDGQVQESAANDDLKKSLAGQIEILQQRMEKQKEARDKLAFIEAELTRIEEQVELIREQAAISTDPRTVSDRIDQVAADLTGRSQWLSDQQQVYGRVEDLLAEPPPSIETYSSEPPQAQ